MRVLSYAFRKMTESGKEYLALGDRPSTLNPHETPTLKDELIAWGYYSPGSDGDFLCVEDAWQGVMVKHQASLPIEVILMLKDYRRLYTKYKEAERYA